MSRLTRIALIALAAYGIQRLIAGRQKEKPEVIAVKRAEKAA